MTTDNTFITVDSQHDELPPDSLVQVMIVLVNPNNVGVEDFLCQNFQKSYWTKSLRPL